MTDRNKAGLFFKISGFTQEEADFIWFKTPRIKEVLKEIRQRKREERALINYVNAAYQKFGFYDRMIKLRKIMEGEIPKPLTKREKVAKQIQNGFDIADKWKREWNDRQSEQEEEKPDNESD